MFGNKMQKIEKLAEQHKSGKLIALLQDKDGEVRHAAIAGLGKCKDDNAYNTLIALLRDSDAAARAGAAKALCALGRTSARVHIEHQIGVETDEKAAQEMKAALAAFSHDEE